MEILDAITFKRLQKLTCPGGYTQLLAFSPESRLVTRLGDDPAVFTSWDLQTGVPVSSISAGTRLDRRPEVFFHCSPTPPKRPKNTKDALSITYSRCGTMFGALFKDGGTPIIRVYNIRSGVPICSRQIEGSVTDAIWTHGECLRFATLEPGSITTWEIGFASEDPVTRIESQSVPSNFDPSKEFIYLPTPSRLAFVLENTALVWDAQNSRFLLNSTDIKKPRKMTFSPDGRFFACGTDGPEIYFWKESPAGYILGRKIMSSAREHIALCEPVLSPNGQSLVAFTNSTIRRWDHLARVPVVGEMTLELWRTTYSMSLPSSAPIQDLNHTEPFIVEFSPDKSLAVSARLAGNTATVLDLESGSPRLIIDTGMKICGLRVDGSSIVVVGNGKVITWNLPPGDRVLNAKANVSDSVRTTTFDNSLWLTVPATTYAAITPDLKYIIIVGGGGGDAGAVIGLHTYDVSTGKHLMGIPSVAGDKVWIAPDGYEFWCSLRSGDWRPWTITEDGELIPGHYNVASEGKPPRPLEGRYPWERDGSLCPRVGIWITDASEKRVLGLPPHWDSMRTDSVFGGRFLALVYRGLQEAAILESLDE